jgi:hypothetical protein
MAESEVQICNIALARIQGEPITDLETDDSKSAVLCRTLYEEARDATLEDHPWSFAITRQLLTISSDTNFTTLAYQYQLPTDPKCIRPICLLDSLSFYLEMTSYPFIKEGDKLFTDLYAAGLKYIGQVKDPGQFSPSFTNALAWRLAAELLKPIEGSSPVDPWVMYRDAVTSAIAANDHGKQEEPYRPRNWNESRFP